MQQHDILLKLSRVEGVFGPPLEMFSQGGTAITTTVTGSDEYMEHGFNSLLVEPYNLRQVIRYLKLLHESRETLRKLRENALNTARRHPEWKASTGKLAAHLERLHVEGYSNRHLRPALSGFSAVRGHWLDDIWQAERDRAQIAVPSGPYIGPGETLLLNRYRRLKEWRPVQRAIGIFPRWTRKAFRAVVSKVIS
jgi:hypothetical protein